MCCINQCQFKPEEEILMNDILEDMFDESGALDSINTETTKNLSGLVRQLRVVEQEVEEAETLLKNLKAEKQKLSTQMIPDLMDEMGVERVDVDGLTVTKKQIVAASIPVDKRELAFDWLRDRGLDDIIKNDVVCTFGRGQDNLAKDAFWMLKDKGLEPSTKTHIHPMTLKAFVKDRVEQGQEIDLDLFGAFLTNAVEIKRK
tara:strand:+ start:533 stop:1138 length:606 start_codon:yes stop_codon:yes gene_type:complete